MEATPLVLNCKNINKINNLPRLRQITDQAKGIQKRDDQSLNIKRLEATSRALLYVVNNHWLGATS
jgi:hypothetical protein